MFQIDKLMTTVTQRPKLSSMLFCSAASCQRLRALSGRLSERYILLMETWTLDENNLCCNVVHQGGGEVVLWEAYFEAQARLALPTRGDLLGLTS